MARSLQAMAAEALGQTQPGQLNSKPKGRSLAGMADEALSSLAPVLEAEKQRKTSMQKVITKETLFSPAKMLTPTEKNRYDRLPTTTTASEARMMNQEKKLTPPMSKAEKKKAEERQLMEAFGGRDVPTYSPNEARGFAAGATFNVSKALDKNLLGTPESAYQTPEAKASSIAGAAYGTFLPIGVGARAGSAVKGILQGAGVGAGLGVVQGVADESSRAADTGVFEVKHALKESGKNAAINAGLAVGLGGLGVGAAAAYKGIANGGVGRTIGKALSGTKSAVQELGDVMTGGNKAGISFAAKKGPYDALKTDTKSQLTTRLAKEKAPLKTVMDRAYTSIVDDVHAFNQLDKYSEKVLGRKLAESEKTHSLALKSRGSDVISHRIINDAFVDQAGNTGGKSLKEALSSIPPGKFTDFEDYLINRHAPTRFDRGEKVFDDALNWTPEVGASKVAQYEAKYPEFVNAAADIKEFQGNMLDKWLVDGGIITKEQAAAYRDANPNYVPMKRFFSDLEKLGGSGSSTKKGFGNQSVPTKAYGKGGSQRKIISPIEAMIENVDSFVKTVERNKTMQSLVKTVQSDPDAFRAFAEVVDQPPKLDNIKDVDLSTPDGLDEMMSRMSEDFDRVMTKTKLDKDNIVRVLIDGNPVHLKVNDKALLDAMTALGPENGSKLLDGLGWLTNKMKVLTTGANPMFSLTRNLFRDIPQAYISSKSTNNPIRFAADLFDSAWSIVRDKKLYQDFKSMGGGHASSIAADRNLLAQSKRNVLPQKGKLQGIVPRAYGKMENFLNAVETAPRLGEYKRISSGGTIDDRLKGVFEANDITVNFKRRGRLTRELDKVFPYFNAAVQGLDKFARTYKDNPVQATLKSFMAITIPTLAAYAYNYRDPNYQKLSNHEKDNYIMIPKGDGTFFKIAKPKEIGTAFSDIPERLMRQFYQQDPTAFEGFASQLRNTFTLPGIQGGLKSGGITDRLGGVLGDTILGPVADLGANSDFADRPIVSGDLAQFSPELQYDARTSSLSKKIGEYTKTSPKELDYLIRQYSGVLGQVGLPMLQPGSGNAGQSLANSIKQQVTSDPVFSNDIMSRFYDNKSKYDQAKTDEKMTGKLPKWYNDDVRNYLGKVNDEIKDIRGISKAVQADKSLSPTEKRQQLRMLQDSMNRLAEEANKQLKR